MGRRRRDGRPVHPRHQGTRRLHGRHAAHDEERHFHHQRHRARHRLADASLARRVLRSRQGQEPFLGQISLCRPRHSLSRLVARFRVRRQGPHVCPHRSPPQAAGDDVALCARQQCHGKAPVRARGAVEGACPARGAGHVEGRDTVRVLHAGLVLPRQERLEDAVRSVALSRLQDDRRSGRCEDRQGQGRAGHQADAEARQEAL